MSKNSYKIKKHSSISKRFILKPSGRIFAKRGAVHRKMLKKSTNQISNIKLKREIFGGQKIAIKKILNV